MILEGLCATQNPEGSVNIAPMGPIVDLELNSFLFRPFQSSTTFQNLAATRCGVFHVTDDVGMIARAAIGRLDILPDLFPATVIAGHVIASACRWYEFEVVSIDASQPRSEIVTRMKHVGRLRDYWGLNRARHAVLEAAILCTRLHILDLELVQQQFQQLQVIVEKTAHPDDAETFEMLQAYAATRLE